jgi:hypothetical protein
LLATSLATCDDPAIDDHHGPNWQLAGDARQLGFTQGFAHEGLELAVSRQRR